MGEAGVRRFAPQARRRALFRILLDLVVVAGFHAEIGLW
jgi:hypothetical protein